MSTTALPIKGATRRAVTADSTPSTTSNSAAGTPYDSSAASASSTSLSSLGSVEDCNQEPETKLVDTHGNQFKLPDYTIKQIRDAIPAHCFERSGLRSLSYVARDVASLATTFVVFNHFVTPEYIPSTPIRAGLWALYTVLQGLFATGLWILAHECGHQSFSPSKTLNDTVGWICHSFLLVPYFSWKIAHGKHHKATGNMERDMVFVPRTREQHATNTGELLHEMHELMEETPIVSALHLLLQQIGGWLMHLTVNVTGHNNHHKQSEGKGVGKQNGWFGGVNHFNPSSPLFEKRDEHLVLLSDLGLAITAAVLFLIGRSYGAMNVFVWYGIPYLWVNHWLVAITYLQHTDPSLPHYTGSTWTFARGAAATIDRKMGFIGRHIFHGVAETHVLHHYISTIPFYHAEEASEAIKPIMGQHYRKSRDESMIGFLKALWTSSRWCHWVEPMPGTRGDAAGVLFFRNRNGLGQPPAKLSAPAQKPVGTSRMSMISSVESNSD